jgi:hypothetical protein
MTLFLVALCTPLLAHEQTVNVTAPKGSIVAEIADTQSKIILGLSNRSSLAQGHGPKKSRFG